MSHYCVVFDRSGQRLLVATEAAAIEDAMGKFLDNEQPYAVIRAGLSLEQANNFVRSYAGVLAERKARAA